MSIRFAGKHCAVVGATGIIGSQIAKAFASQGAVVSLLGRSVIQQRDKLQAQLQPFTPPTDLTSTKNLPTAHQFIRLDVSDAANIKETFASARVSSYYMQLNSG